jgi:hypothetical protein
MLSFHPGRLSSPTLPPLIAFRGVARDFHLPEQHVEHCDGVGKVPVARKW